MAGAALGAGFLVLPASAATLTVNTTSDNPDPGQTSLRDAIIAADGDTDQTVIIDFDPSLVNAPTFDLTSGLPSLTNTHLNSITLDSANIGNTLTLSQSLMLQGGDGTGINGADGAAGAFANGGDGNGGAGGNGGGVAGGSVTALGNINVTNSSIFTLVGGNGGNAGSGGNGGAGADGDADHPDGGNGGTGGLAGDGGAGGAAGVMGNVTATNSTGDFAIWSKWNRRRFP
jgi:hypothetical protein